MEGSILIFGANRFSRQQKVLEYANALLEGKITSFRPANPDVLVIEKVAEKNNISIEQVREMIKFLAEYPFQESHKIVIVSKAESLTIPAQNALLKTLEEPPAYALIILEAKSENSLLETVVSRCQKIAVKSLERPEDDSENSVAKIQAMDIGNRFVWAEETSKMEKQDIVDLLEEWVGTLRKDVMRNREAIGVTLKVAKDLDQTNINVRLALEYLVLNI
ncbi:MAG: hypothetical protein WC243_04220 [Patescibacteria group bacterium]|jgi:DNA polymerase-3 subunit delta'